VEIINNCKGIFCSMANELWIKGRLVHRNNWTPTADFLSYLSQLYQSSHFTPKGKNFIEKRTGMVNFSIVGREAPRELRGIYNEWDKKNKEREDMARTIMLDYPDLQACLGGQISIDIQPKGRNKAQASKWVREELGGTAIYFGDNCEIGGNDYDVCVDITENGGIVHKVESPDETLSILNNEN